MQPVTATTTTTIRSQFRPEYVPSRRPASCSTNAAPVRSLLVAPGQTEAALFSRTGVIKIDAAARAKATIALIEAEFKNRRGFYMHTLRRAGIAQHELDDALCEVFSLAVRWAGSYDSSKSDISSWLGNQVVRTVASSTYGTRRPDWRRQQEHELSTEMLVTGFASEPSERSDDAAAPAEQLVVAAFLTRLSDELTATESAVIDICGLDLLHERLACDQLARVRDLLGVRSQTTVRNFAQKLGNKVRALAIEHFSAEELSGRPGFNKVST